jgi:hypothetical protein
VWCRERKPRKHTKGNKYTCRLKSVPTLTLRKNAIRDINNFSVFSFNLADKLKIDTI